MHNCILLVTIHQPLTLTVFFVQFALCNCVTIYGGVGTPLRPLPGHRLVSAALAFASSEQRYLLTNPLGGDSLFVDYDTAKIYRQSYVFLANSTTNSMARLKSIRLCWHCLN